MRSIQSCFFAVMTGCAPDLVDLHAWDDGEGVVEVDTADTAAPGSTRVTTTAVGDLFETTWDARDGAVWVAVDFDQDGVEVDPTDPSWDLMAKRYDIAGNSGASGSGAVGILFLPGVDLEAASVPSDAVWGVDQPDGDDANLTADLVFGTWYDYNGDTHVLTPVEGTWLVQTTDGAVVGLRIDRYYSDTGDSAYFALTWRRLP